MKRGRLEFAFFGSSLVSSYCNAAATYYRGLLRALADRGHGITFYEPDVYDRQRFRDIPDPSWAKVVVYPGDHESAALYQLALAAKRADVLVKASAIGVYDQLLEEAVPAAAGRSRLAVYWDVDAPATLERLKSNPSDPLRSLIPRYDAVFTHGGGAPIVQAYRAFGARTCVPIYNGLDPQAHYPAERDERYRADLSLFANRSPDHENRVREFFFEPARILPERRFMLGGSGWSDDSGKPNVRCLGHLPTSEHNAFNASALVVLSVVKDSVAAIGFSPATRVFEAAGAGACIITDAWKGIELFLEPGREVLIASDGMEVVEHLQRLSRARAELIGRTARQRVLAEHTYAGRAEQVERVLCAGSVPALEV